MVSVNDVRDEMFKASERVIRRPLSSSERDRLIDAYNNSQNTDIFDRCIEAIEEVFDVGLEVRVLLEKSASVDRVNMALRNLLAITADSVVKK